MKEKTIIVILDHLKKSGSFLKLKTNQAKTKRKTNMNTKQQNTLKLWSAPLMLVNITVDVNNSSRYGMDYYE